MTDNQSADDARSILRLHAQVLIRTLVDNNREGDVVSVVAVVGLGVVIYADVGPCHRVFRS